MGKSRAVTAQIKVQVGQPGLRQLVEHRPGRRCSAEVVLRHALARRCALRGRGYVAFDPGE